MTQIYKIFGRKRALEVLRGIQYSLFRFVTTLSARRKKYKVLYILNSSYTSNPGMANCEAKDSTRLRSSITSLLLLSPLRNSFCNFPCSLCKVLVICTALRRKSAIDSKSPSKQPLVVMAGVPEGNYK